MDSFETIERFLEVRLKMWNNEGKRQKVKTGPVVTISREPGCNGELIARILANKLGLVIYGKEIVEQIAKVTHVSEQLVSTLDEKSRSELENWIKTTQNEHELSSFTYLAGLKKAVFSIATHSNAIIFGRGGNFLLPPEKRTSLRLIAPLDVRIKNIMADLKLPAKSAKNHIEKKEKEQRLFVNQYFKADIKDPIHYHLVINTALVTPETIADIVKVMTRAES